MVRINEGVPAKPLIQEIPDSTYSPVGGSEGAIAAEDVPYFDDPNAPMFDGEQYEEPLPEAYTAPLPEDVPVIDGPPPDGAVMEGPVEGTRGDLVDQLLDGVLSGN
jgi:hypothetical protein